MKSQNQRNSWFVRMPLLLAILGVAFSLAAKDIYVSPSGNDSTGDGSREKPYASPTWVFAQSSGKVGSGDTIYVLPGTYEVPSRVYSPYSVSVVGLHTPTGPNGETEPILDAGYPAKSNSVFYANNPAITFSDMTFRNGYGKNPGSSMGSAIFGTFAGVYNCTFTNCVMGETYYGGAISGSSYCEITNCRFYACKSYGNRYRNASALGTSGQTILSDCTFEGCSSEGANVGTAVVGENSIVRNCHFKRNTAFVSAGLYVCSGTVVSNCTFTENTATTGDGVGVSGSASNIVNCTVTDSTAAGGGAFIVSGSPLWMEHCVASNIVARNGNAGLFLTGSATVTNCVFCHCISTNNSTVKVGKYNDTTSQTLVDCIIADNFSYDGQGAGVSMPYGAKRFFRRCAITNNYTTYWSSGGVSAECATEWYDCLISSNSAGYYAGLNLARDGTILSNCVISMNVARSGGAGGVYVANNCTDLKILDCTIVGNQAPTGGYGGLHIQAGATIRNTLIANNTSKNEPAGAIVPNNSRWENCTVIGNTITSSGVGNLRGEGTGCVFVNCLVAKDLTTSDAGFWCSKSHTLTNCVFASKDTTATADSVYKVAYGSDLKVDADYRPLHKSSPCVDAGLNLPWMYGAKDLDGHSRIIGTSVDVGCYEYRPRRGLVMTFR